MKHAVLKRGAKLLLGLLLAAIPGQPLRAESATYRRSVEQYLVPDVTLVNQNGEKVRLVTLFDRRRPVVFSFISATGTTISPILSAGYAGLQKKLGTESEKVQLVSISMDPEHDTPAVMRGYLKRYGARPGWDFLTGTPAEIESVMRAMNAQVGKKSEYYPLLLIRSVQDGRWTRINGIMSASEFLAEVQKAGG